LCLICQHFGKARMELTHECSLSLNDQHEKSYTGTAQHLAWQGLTRANRPAANFNWHGTWYKPQVTTFHSWSLPEVSSMPNVRQWLNLAPLDKGGGKNLQLSFSPNEMLFIPINRHVTWKFTFSSGVPISYCLRNCLVIGWFKGFQPLQVNLGTRGFTWSLPGVMWFCLCLVTHLVTSLCDLRWSF